MASMMNKPVNLYRAGNGALFTSKKCPCGPGIENSCELPFGFIWTPMAHCEDVSVVNCNGEALLPVLCLTCLSYVNIYADVDVESSIWTCPLCGEKNVAPKGAFSGSGPLSSVLASPIVEFRQQIRATTSPKPTKSCTYIIVLDSNLNRDEARSVGSAVESVMHSLINEGTAVNLGLIVFDEVVSIYQLGLSGMASADVCSSRQANKENYLLNRKNHMAVRSYLARINHADDVACLWRCLSAVYGIFLSAEDSVETSNHQTKPLSRLEMLRQKKEARLRKKRGNDSQLYSQGSIWVASREKSHIRRPMRCTGEAIQTAIDLSTFGSKNPTNSSRIILFTNGCPNLGDGSVVDTDVDATQIHPKSGRQSADVVNPQRLATAVQYFELTAKYALENGVGIDILCTGGNELGMPAYQALVDASSGYVLPQESFTTEHLNRNLHYLLSKTYVSTATKDASSTNTLERSFNGCIVDTRMSRFVSATHLVGSGELIDDNSSGLLPNELSAFAIGASLSAGRGFATHNLPSRDILDESCTRLRMGRYDPLATLSIMLQVDDEVEQSKFAFFQCIVRYVDRTGCDLVTRVYTHRLPIARTVSEFLDEVDDDVVPVVLGREAVYRSMFGREIADDGEIVLAPDPDQLEQMAYEAKRDLDATVQRISGAFRLLGLQRGMRDLALAEEGGARTTESALDFAFPPELATSLRRLFHLRRGALLSTGPLQSMDDRAETRSIFLRLPMEDCLSLMAPTLWSTGPIQLGSYTSQLELIPSETLSLWDNVILVADHFDNLFVWSGRSTLGAEYDKIREDCKSFLLERSKNRFPMPKLHMLSEGDSMSRRLFARLAPSHADPPEHQMAHFPALASLSQDELATLRSKFRFYDAASDASFRSWFWGVASAASASKDEGLSLCE